MAPAPLSAAALVLLLRASAGTLFPELCVGPENCGSLGEESTAALWRQERTAETKDPFAPCCKSCDSADSCSNSRNEEVLFAKYLLPYVRFDKGIDRVFVEIGGNDGVWASNTLYLENCLQWKGIMVEAQPESFRKMVAARPRVAAVNAAGCDRHTQVVRFSQKASPTSSVVVGVKPNQPFVEVPCAPLGDVFQALNASSVAFFSLDVEGFEIEVLGGIDFNEVRVAALVVEELRKTKAKNDKVRHVLETQARMSLAFVHCWMGHACDSYWYNPRYVDFPFSSSGNASLPPLRPGTRHLISSLQSCDSSPPKRKQHHHR